MKLIKTKDEFVSNQPDFWFVVTDDNLIRRSDWSQDIRKLEIQEYNSAMSLGEREIILYTIEFEKLEDLIELVPEEFL